MEYFAKAAWDQYQLPFTIVRPFNCVGIGEGRALGDVEVDSGNVKLAMSHVVPDLVQKVVKGQDPLHILGEGNQVRHYTYGGDLAAGTLLTVWLLCGQDLTDFRPWLIGSLRLSQGYGEAMAYPGRLSPGLRPP